jgi:hypothetical protein
MKNQSIKNNLFRAIFFAGFLAITFFAVGSVSVRAHDGDEDADCRSKECRQLLVSAKQATARYHDIQNALSDGFFQASPCVSHPTLGAMGFHFINIGRIMNPLVRADEPEVLLYLPDEDGEMRLVGLEYVVPIGLTIEPPVLYGQTFHLDGPPLNQYSLHVWAWRNNPSGVFMPFNPKLSCPGS